MSGSVNEVSTGNPFIAYLYNFEVNQALLTEEHKNWLRTTFLPKVVAEVAKVALSAEKDYLQIRLFGTASRTGTISHNLALSRRRAQAVAEFLKQIFSFDSQHLRLSTSGLSEAPAAVLGKVEAVEDLNDRAVLIYMRRVRPDTPEEHAPVIMKRPAVYDKFFIGIHSFEVESFNPPLARRGIGGRYDQFDIQFYIRDTQRNFAYYNFKGRLFSPTFGALDPYAEDDPDTDADVMFRTTVKRTVRDFEGPAAFELPFVGHTYGVHFGGYIQPPFPGTPGLHRYHVEISRTEDPSEEDSVAKRGLVHGVRDDFVNGEFQLAKKNNKRKGE